MPKPSVTITLEPDGTLSMGIAGRTIAIRPGHIEATLQQVLFAQALGQVKLGQDGAPTQSQADCWAKHSKQASASCSFCVAAGRTASYQPKVEVVPQGMTKAKREAQERRNGAKCKSTPKELGL